MQIIVFKNIDGSCGIIYPSAEALKKIEDIAIKDVPEGLPWRITTIDRIPTDRHFREAWTDHNPTETVDIDLNKAKDVHMRNIRLSRTRKFAELGFPVKLDPDLEKGIISEETRAKLQKLRDIPQNLDLSIATTPEELKAIWPTELL